MQIFNKLILDSHVYFPEDCCIILWMKGQEFLSGFTLNIFYLVCIYMYLSSFVKKNKIKVKMTVVFGLVGGFAFLVTRFYKYV